MFELTCEDSLDPIFVAHCKSITAKRARIVIDHILKYGVINTQQLSNEYGYTHPPRALQDVKDHGIPLLRHTVKSDSGRSIAAYTFGNSEAADDGRLGGRQSMPKKFKRELCAYYNHREAFSDEVTAADYLQIDHRIPYGIAGESPLEVEHYMLLSASSQRKKSRACENCPNFTDCDITVCQGCYWAFPENHHHVAMKEQRCLDIVFDASEVDLYDQLTEICKKENIPVQEIVKALIEQLGLSDKHHV